MGTLASMHGSKHKLAISMFMLTQYNMDTCGGAELQSNCTTHMLGHCLQVLGTVKDACLVAVGILFLHEAVSTLQLFGYSMSICGFITYNLIKAGVLQPDSGSIGKANGGSSSSGRGKGSGSGGLSGLITAVDSGSSSRGVMWRSSAGAAMQAGGHYGAAALKRLLPSKAQ